MPGVAWGRGGGQAGAPPGSDNNNAGIGSIEPGNTWPISLRPGMVVVGTVVGSGGSSVSPDHPGDVLIAETGNLILASENQIDIFVTE